MDKAIFETAHLAALNDQQLAAVEAVNGPVLLLAVPGSGKTTVLITRLGYMTEVCGIAPERSGEERNPLQNGGRSCAATLEPAENAEKSGNDVNLHLGQVLSKGNNCFHVGKREEGNRIEQRKRCLTKIAV